MIPNRSQRPMAVPKNLETRIEIVKAIHKLMTELATDSDMRKFDPNQPRAPAGNPDGGQWTSESTGSGNDLATPFDGGHRPAAAPVQVAGLKCEGFAGGCQSGGSYGSSAMYNIYGRNLCWDCAVKILDVQNASSSEKVLRLEPHLIIGK